MATETKKANIEKLGKMNENKIAMILKIAFSHINKEIENVKEGRVIIPGFGNFNICTIENEMDGEKVVRKHILFSAAKNKTGASPP